MLQPDLLVVDDRSLITDRGIEGAPLLVVEIVSQTTAGRDRGINARRYAQFGVPHYWLVDPDARCVECHRLAGCDDEQVAVADCDAVLAVPGFAGPALPLSLLWANSEAPTRH